MTRMEGDSSGPVNFKSGAQRAEADEALLARKIHERSELHSAECHNGA
jgi:hypothetical protein